MCKIVKVFVSQPMSGLSMEQIKADRDRAFLNLANNYIDDEEELEIIDNLQEDEEKTPLQYLGYDIAVMSDADFVYFCRGWETHRGCVTEFDIARRFGYKIIFEEN